MASTDYIKMPFEPSYIGLGELGQASYMGLAAKMTVGLLEVGLTVAPPSPYSLMAFPYPSPYALP